MTPLALPLKNRKDVSIIPVPAEVADIEALVERLIEMGEFGTWRNRPRLVSLDDRGAYAEALGAFIAYAFAHGASAAWVADPLLATVGLRDGAGTEAVFAVRIVALMLD